MKGLVRRDFARWLRFDARNRALLMRRNATWCPLAQYLKVPVYDKLDWEDGFKLPEWAVEFVRRVDSGARGNQEYITSEQALGILGRIR